MTRLRHPVLGAALVALLLAAAQQLGRDERGMTSLETLERWTLDWRFRVRGPQAAAPEVALVVFDDATAQRAGPLFERRAGWATVISAVKASGASVIGVDAVFDSPENLLDPGLKARVVAWSAEHPAPDAADATGLLLAEVSHELQGDAELAAAIRAAGNVVLILFAGNSAQASPLDPTWARARYAQSTPREHPAEEVAGLVASLPAFNAAAKAIGFATVREDESRTVRRMSFANGFQGGVYFPFTVPVLATYWGLGRGKLAYLGPQQQVRLGEHPVALDDDHLWLNYRGPEGTVPTWSAVDLIEGRVPAGALAGKIVLLGVTRLGYDMVRTPFKSMPGVEAQATAIDNVLRGDSLRRSNRLQDAAATLGVALLVALLFALRGLKPAGQLGAALALVVAWLGASFLAFTHWAAWWPWVGPSVAALGAAVTGLVLSYAEEALQRVHLRKAFGHYLGQEALSELLKNPGLLQLGGERRTLTVLFSDICGFTTMSEQLAPDKLVAVLNTYLTPMTRAVLDQRGLLDKYIGDAVMAVFGAPVPRPDHVALGLKCVLQMHRELEELNTGPLKALGLNIAIGVGVNTGDMVVGNMGSQDRFDYTVAGDTVNLASRLEGLTRTYGVFCIVGDQTRASAPEGFVFRELDLVQVKGKHTSVPIHEVVAGPGRVVSGWTELEVWQRGVSAFRAGRLPEAREAFTAFAAANPTDAVSTLYLDRLKALPEQAPADFSPVAVFSTK